MADNVTLDAGSGGDTIAADDISSVKYPRSKITLGADGVNDGDVSSSNPMPVTHAALTELAAAIDTEVQVDVVGALPAGTNAIGKLAANSGVDIGDVDVTSLPTTVHSADFDTGAGTDTTLAFGIAVPASGGAAVIPGDATAGLKVDLGADNDVTVTGTVTANAGTNLNTSALALEAGGNLAAAATSLATLDNIVSGSEAQVDIVAALPAGTNNIGDVDVLTVPADPFGANADAAATAGSTGSIQAKLRLITSQLDAIKTSVETLDNTVGGSELQVDLVSANVTNAGTFATQSTLTPATSGGLDTFKSTDIDETEEDVKTSAGLLYWIYCVNTNAAARYLKVYNATAANTTVGSTATKLDLLIPPSNSGFFIQFPHGITFSTAICVAATTGVGDADTGAPGASEVQVTIGYK